MSRSSAKLLCRVMGRFRVRLVIKWLRHFRIPELSVPVLIDSQELETRCHSSISHGKRASLEEVIAHYNTGIRGSPTLDPNLAKHSQGGIKLSGEDQRALVAFLKTLSPE